MSIWDPAPLGSKADRIQRHAAKMRLRMDDGTTADVDDLTAELISTPPTQPADWHTEMVEQPRRRPPRYSQKRQAPQSARRKEYLREIGRKETA